MRAPRALDLSLAAFALAALVVGLALNTAHEKRVEAEARQYLVTMRDLRESVLAGYLESLRSEVELWSSQPVVTDVLAMHSAGSDGTPASAAAPAIDQDQRLRAFAAHHGYYDVFFINTAGDVIYTLAREADYGSNLRTGPFAATGLGRLFQRLAENPGAGVTFEDFSLYPPSDHAPAAFLGTRVYAPSVAQDGSGRQDPLWIGVYAVQIPEAPINHIMQFSAGLGRTGEVYLVGADRLMRSTSRFFDHSTVLTTPVNGATVEAALAGREGVQVVDDYRNTPVYSAYRSFEIDGVRWVVLAEQDVAEVRASLLGSRWWLAGGLLLVCAALVLVRHLALRAALPAPFAALLGLTIIGADDPG
jgi:hypothetical protein